MRRARANSPLHCSGGFGIKDNALIHPTSCIVHRVSRIVNRESYIVNLKRRKINMRRKLLAGVCVLLFGISGMAYADDTTVTLDGNTSSSM